MNAPGGAFSRSETGPPAAGCGVGGRFPGPSTAESSAAALPGSAGRYPVTENLADALGRTTNSVRTVWFGGAPDPAYAPLATRTEYPFGTDGYRVSHDHNGTATVVSNGFGAGCEITRTVSAGVTHQTTRYHGGPTVTEKHWDGRWTRETRAESFTAQGCRVETVAVESSDAPALTNRVTTYDFLGREVSVSTPAFGGGWLVSATSYDGASSRALRLTRTGSPDTLYAYDALGNLRDTAVDVNGNGVIDYDGMDRISRSETAYTQSGADWWRETVSSVWNVTNSAQSLTSSRSRMRMTGLGTAASGLPGIPDGAVLTAESTEQTLPFNRYSQFTAGPLTRSQTWLAPASASRWDVRDTPESSFSAVQVSLAGHAVTNVSASCVTNSFTYDGFGRQTSATDGRGNTRVTLYNALGQVAATADYLGTPPLLAINHSLLTNLTSYAYDAAGRRISANDPLTNTVFTAYDSLGNVTAQWGATYPVAYEYDTAGRKIAMATTRDASLAITNHSSFLLHPSSFDRTTWLYDHATGLLTNKLYADGTGPSYTYTADGKLAARTWARGVTAAYSYDALGQLAGTGYSDATPDVSYAYDRLGRQVSAISSVATNTAAYCRLYQESETQNGVQLKRGFTENTGLLEAVALTDSEMDVDRWFYGDCEFLHIYNRDSCGRLSGVESLRPQDPSWQNYLWFSNGYLYEPGSDLVREVNGHGYQDEWMAEYMYIPDAVRTVSYEPRRDLIAAVSNSWDGTLVSAFDYVNDAAGRRTRRVDATQALPVTNVFGYNPRSEVTEALMGDDIYGYAYDPLGNRTVTTENTETTEYVVNNLNQYMNILCVPASLRLNDAGGEETQRRRGAETERQGAGGVGGLLAVTTVSAADPQPVIHFPNFDANGNVTEYVATNGTVAARYAYDAFGSTTAQSGPLAESFTHRFSTKPFDAETGLVMYQLRPYEPGLGRWLGRDPIEEKGGVGLYGFVGNDPVNRWDLLGQLCCHGKKYNMFTECCCGGTVRSRKAVGTNVKVCTKYGRTVTVGDISTDLGGIIPEHRWIEMGNTSFGFWPVGIRFNDSYVDRPGKVCEEIMLSPCLYDIELFKAALLSFTSHYYPPYHEKINNCVVWVYVAVSYAKREAKTGCTQ